MEQEIQISIDVLKEQKNNLLNNLKNNTNETKIEMLHNLNEIDKLLEKYYSKISK